MEEVPALSASRLIQRYASRGISPAGVARASPEKANDTQQTIKAFVLIDAIFSFGPAATVCHYVSSC
jgi:hypothetical protein